MEPERHTADTAISAPHDVAVLLFIDIADSTALTEHLGDATFRERARQLDASLRQFIRDRRGIPIEGKLLGDGVMATFASAHQAIEAALLCRAGGDEAGLPLHIGIHAGDVIHEDGNVYGGAVNIAARIADAAPPGEVFVSETVRGLARTSTKADMSDRGEYVLKGIKDKHRLYAVYAPGETRRAPEPERAGRRAAALGSHVILVTDLVAGSHLAERADDPEVQAVMEQHVTIVEDALQAHGGAEVKSMGDSYLALFSSPASALESAIAIQRAVEEHNSATERPLRVRIGLSAGEPVRVGGELHGAAVMLAWRAAHGARPAQVVATEAVRQLVLGKGYRFQECGQVELRTSKEAARLYDVSWQDSAG
jgi:class 3 adenylate cyclase